MRLLNYVTILPTHRRTGSFLFPSLQSAITVKNNKTCIEEKKKDECVLFNPFIDC